MAVSATSFKPGHKHSPGVVEKISASKKGKKSTSSTKFAKGITPWNKTDDIFLDCVCCGKRVRIQKNQIGKKKFCSKQCFYQGRELNGTFRKGHGDLVPAESRGHSVETKNKISEKSRALAKRGEQHPLWRGGSRTERKIAMGRYEYKEWRSSVFKRDDYTCVLCGKKGVYLEADHIKPWATHKSLRYSVENGRTLCRPCHISQPTHGIGALSYKA